MSVAGLENEKNFLSALITALAILPAVPTRAEVAIKGQHLAALFGFDGDLGHIIEEAMLAVDTRMGTGVSLVDHDALHDEEWVRKREINWKYSEAYESFLKKQGWPPTVVRSLSDVGTKILGHLQDPTSVGAWDRRGLVIGHVQSGKTANYLGLIGKAADAGYKFIIVIAGIHNNLRRQTQERIDEGFVGRSSDPNHRRPVGVGLSPAYPYPVTLTTIHDDFNSRTANQGGWKLNDFSKPIIFVIKKNVRTLEALHKWLKEMNAEGDGRIGDVPLLMIDDEADNASINTNRPELDPTRTNALIRRVLGLFAKSCYVGYTATPFANIFINPEAFDDEARAELFPRDFIYCLDAPSSYFGPDKVFLEEESSGRVLRVIDDAEDRLPFAHKKDHELSDLPPSLYRAMNAFVIARTIRSLRGQGNRHCSMMINVSRFVSIQQSLRDFVSVYEKRLRDAIKANYRMPDDVADKNGYMKSLRLEFEDQFAAAGVPWSQVKAGLNDAVKGLRVMVVNSKSDEVLDYRSFERDGEALTAIAVGGLSLSRGLTLEGLCISYMYRNTRMYDTLMQMGRWFGYRPNYEDLCRVYLSEDSIEWYAHIAEAAEELRSQIKRMRRDKLSPRQFGLYVKAHPDALLITAANKMRTGHKVKVRQNFSGKLVESHILPAVDDVNQRNEELIAEFWRRRFGATGRETTKGWVFDDVPVSTISDFLVEFRVHADFANRKSAIISYLGALSESHPVGDVLLISISGNGEDKGDFRLGHQERDSASLKNGAWFASRQRVASRGDEKLGLTHQQCLDAEAEARNDGGKAASDTHYRGARKKPLLMLHVLGVGGEARRTRVPAFGVSFPPGHYDTEVEEEVVANAVWMGQMTGDLTDSPDNDEDYDD